jgi:hypothetical protein
MTMRTILIALTLSLSLACAVNAGGGVRTDAHGRPIVLTRVESEVLALDRELWVQSMRTSRRMGLDRSQQTALYHRLRNLHGIDHDGLYYQP